MHVKVLVSIQRQNLSTYIFVFAKSKSGSNTLFINSMKSFSVRKEKNTLNLQTCKKSFVQYKSQKYRKYSMPFHMPGHPCGVSLEKHCTL